MVDEPVKPIEINPNQIPIVGSVIRTYYNTGHIYEIVTQACTPIPNILIRAFFANIPMLIWSIVKPDPVDYVQERFGHGHHKRRRRDWTKGDIDVDKPSGGRGHLRWVSFLGSELLDKIGWYCLVVDATEDFLVNWTSMAYRYSGCQDPLSGHGSSRRSTLFAYFHDTSPLQVTFDTWTFTAGYFATAASVSKTAAGARVVTGTVTFGDPGRTPVAQIGRVYMTTDYGHGEVVSEMDMSAPSNGGDRTASIAIPSYDVLEPAATYRLYVEASDTGWIGWAQASLQISGFTAPSLIPDP